MEERKYHWSFSDDYTCCRIYLEYAVSNAYNKDLEELISRVIVALPQIKRSSLQMKLANIKWLSDHEPAARLVFPYGDGIRMGKGLEEYSEQCLQAFLQALKDVVGSKPVDDPDIPNPKDHDPVVPDPQIVYDFLPGDTIRHKSLGKSFGIGTVSRTEGKNLWIKFDNEEKLFQLPEALRFIQKLK